MGYKFREGDHRGPKSDLCHGASKAEPSFGLVHCEASKGREILFYPDGGDMGTIEGGSEEPVVVITSPCSLQSEPRGILTANHHGN